MLSPCGNAGSQGKAVSRETDLESTRTLEVWISPVCSNVGHCDMDVAVDAAGEVDRDGRLLEADRRAGVVVEAAADTVDVGATAVARSAEGQVESE
jgi:hypothetical protein